jgi:chromosome segregation ATPase
LEFLESNEQAFLVFIHNQWKAELMTGISSLIGSLQKNQAVVEELMATTQRELTAILTQINKLQEKAAQLQKDWEERHASEEELTREVSSLEGELSAESEERGKLESTSASQQKVIIKAKAEREKIQRELAEVENRLETAEDEIRNINRALRDVEKNTVNVDEKLSSSDEKLADQLQTLASQVTEARENAELQEAKYKALRYLLQKGIISMPEAKVATELQGKDATTLDHLQKTTFIGRFKVREIIQQMAERKIVRFEKGTGQVKVLKTIDL